jgi:hypothetical protein
VTDTPTHDRQLARPLGPLERRIAVVVAVVVASIGVIGAVVSFDAVSEELGSSFGGLAWLVPLGIDLGILAFSGLHLLLVRLEMPLPWLRLIPHGLIAATVWLNVEAGTTTVERLAHGVMPLLWALAVEVASHAVAVHTGLSSGRRMEGIRRSRWLLAPLSTAVLWRRMVLWEVRSYAQALELERERLLARADLAATYGRVAWRWRAPLAERVRLRLGAAPRCAELITTSAPAVAETTPAVGAVTTSGVGAPALPAPALGTGTGSAAATGEGGSPVAEPVRVGTATGTDTGTPVGTATGTPRAEETGTATGGTGGTGTGRAGTTGTPRPRRTGTATGTTGGTATGTNRSSKTGTATGTGRSPKTGTDNGPSLTDQMRAYARQLIAEGGEPTGPMLHTKFGGNPATGLGRRIAREAKEEAAARAERGEDDDERARVNAR